jgi:hypothetical protein
MSAPNSCSPRNRPVRLGVRLCAGSLAAVLALLAGCASDRTMQRRDLPAASSVLKPVGTIAPIDDGCRAHVPTRQELAKQRFAIDPLRVPGLYTELFYGQRPDASASIEAGGMSFRPYRRFEDPGSGLSGFVLLDEASGHAIVLFKGMDRPFAERDGLGGVFTDLGGVLAAKFGTGNGQFPLAEDAYTETLCEDLVSSVELVGYSMGSQIANYLSAKYGAYAVVFGDMGLDAKLLERYSGGDVKAARARVREHVVSLSLGGDMVVRMFGVGEVVGTVVQLPGGLAGVFHQPEIYANAASTAIREREAQRSPAQGGPVRAAASRMDAQARRSSH